ARLGHARIFFQQRLDLPWKDILTAGYEHVIDATYEIVEAIFVTPHQIAAPVITVVGHDFRGSVGLIVVPVHKAGSVDLQLTFFGIEMVAVDQSDFDFGMSAAD